MGIKIGNTDISKIKIASGLTPRLPSAYQEVEYVESSGSQYIDTGFYPTGNSEIEFDFMMLPGSGAGSFGVDSGWTSRAFSVFTDRILCYGYQYQSQATYFTDNVKYKLEFKNLTGYLNGVQRFTYTAQTFTSSYSCYVFAKRRTNSIEMYAKCRVYGLKLWNSGTLEKDFIPCYRIADGEIGLYDMVNDVFYTNAGSGTFSKGADVGNLYKEIKKVYLGSTQVRPPTSSDRPDLDQYSLLATETLSGFSNPHGIAVSEDGLKLYIGPGSGTIRQYTMTGGLLSNISGIESTSSSITTRGLYCKADGTKLFSLADDGSKRTITMLTPFSFSGSSATNSSGKVGSQEPTGCWFTPDGNYYFTCDGGGGSGSTEGRNYLYKIPVTTAWDFSTATTTGMTSVHLTPGNRLYNVAISPTGLKMFIGGWGPGQCYIYQYNLSTAWDITTATYSGKSLGYWGRACFSVSGDGSIFVTDTSISTPTVYQYTAS